MSFQTAVVYELTSCDGTKWTIIIIDKIECGSKLSRSACSDNLCGAF